MKKFILALFLPALAHAGSVNFYQNLGGNLGTIVISSGTPIPVVALDTSTSGGAQSGASPYTFNLTLASNATFAAVACAYVTADSATAVTIGGQAMATSTNTLDGSGQYQTIIYNLNSPPTGTQSISIATVSGIKDRALCWAASYSGTKSGAAVDPVASAIYASGTGNVVTAFLTTSVGNEILMDVMVDGNGDSPSPGASQTQRFSSGNGSGLARGSTEPAVASGPYTMTWVGISVPTTISAIGIRPGP